MARASPSALLVLGIGLDAQAVRGALALVLRDRAGDVAQVTEEAALGRPVRIRRPPVPAFALEHERDGLLRDVARALHVGGLAVGVAEQAPGDPVALLLREEGARVEIGAPGHAGEG